MNSQFEHQGDPLRLVDVDRKRAAYAFDQWCAAKGRAPRNSATNSANLFCRAVEQSLDLARDKSPRSLKIPTGRSGWSNWRLGVGKPTTRIRFDVCWAIWMLTNVDVTSNGFLQQLPVNATEMVRLGKATLVPCKTNSGLSELNVGELQFSLSSAKDVWLSQAKQRPAPKDKTTRIGTVRYGLREASISVQSSTSLHPILTHLSPGEVTAFGQASGAVISIDDDDDSPRWRVQPSSISDQVLQARFENLRLANNEFVSTPIGVSISVSEGDIFPNISLDETTQDVMKLSNKDRELARIRLIEQVLRHRITENGTRRRYILSQSRS